jgi:hypothetical protein
MSRYDDLRRMREAKFATTAATPNQAKLLRQSSSAVATCREGHRKPR